MKVNVFYDILFLMRRFKHTLHVEKKRWEIPGWEKQVDQINPAGSSNPDNACLLRPWGPVSPTRPTLPEAQSSAED